MQSAGRRITTAVGIGLLAVAGIVAVARFADWRPSNPLHSGEPSVRFAGSESCRPCHPTFHEKWATSFHGLAMQPFTPAFAEQSLLPHRTVLERGGRRYQAVFDAAESYVRESGPEGTLRWPIVQVLGGKDVCYFLTPRDRGFLQVLPLAWDVERREWFSTSDSAVRRFEGIEDQALPWTDRAYTFNTACHGCHVSQVRTNYDPATDSYHTEWAEPGISCETCHGPGAAHVALFQRLPQGSRPKDPAIVSMRNLTVDRRNDLCASCHAKAGPVGTGFAPGGRFYDHFDLVTLESPDYYPDGRDLGENYTLTSWLMSPCLASGSLDCLRCHTSSGRYRFEERPNDACLPCHAARVGDAAGHSHHVPDRPGGRCVDCHMPTTRFARMRRSDHSMRPPVPAASLAFGSPNACTLCHEKKDAGWADRVVRSWRTSSTGRGGDALLGSWERRILQEGRLVSAARRGDWLALPAILAYLEDPERNAVVTSSLVRLLGSCPDPSKFPGLRKLLGDNSALVRSAAASVLVGDAQSRALLVAATRDETRLVRVRAAEALAGDSLVDLKATARRDVARASGELERSLEAWPDQFVAHYNLGNLDLARDRPADAAAHYRRAIALRPDHVESLVNLAMAEARSGRLTEAEAPLRAAIAVDARSVPARLNLALLLGETGRSREAEAELGRVLEIEPRQAQALYNLAMLLASRDTERAITLARAAAEAAPTEPRYAWTAAWLALRSGDTDLGLRLVGALVRAHPGYAEGWRLKAAALEKAGRRREALGVYRAAARAPGVSAAERHRFEAEAERLE